MMKKQYVQPSMMTYTVDTTPFMQFSLSSTFVDDQFDFLSREQQRLGIDWMDEEEEDF